MEEESSSSDEESSNDSNVSGCETNNGQMFSLKSVNLVAAWSNTSEFCAICHEPLETKCIKCIVNNINGDEIVDCDIGWSSNCDHAYHVHCINQWIGIKNVCPLDSLEWKGYQQK
ncbi:RING-box protein 1b-like [Teleopsis dalmanni]|uniref:RING-box protein 1b-like n=1 Tax=Teleopsis dalmanni TaxID=139649 RepID=UPI0018CFE524|nr:RING-box protein 1b-like [Teleopsis dalmanni]